MNISPTPRRYAPRTAIPRTNPFPNSDKYHFTDPMNRNRFQNVKLKNDDDVLLPPEYKLSTQTFNELIDLNKRLTNMLEGKQREISELKAENNEFRSKLWKYTEMADKYKNELDRRDFEEKQRILSQNEHRQPDYIQINKKRDKKSTNTYIPPTAEQTPDRNIDSREHDMHTQKIEELIKNVEHISKILSQPDNKDTTPDSESFKTEKQSISTPSDSDILMTESSELRRLEEQIRMFQQRLNIKQQNEQRKISLQRRLEELKEMLDSTEKGKTDNGSEKHIFYSINNEDDDVKPSYKQKSKVKRIDRSNIFRTPSSDM